MGEVHLVLGPALTLLPILVFVHQIPWGTKEEMFLSELFFFFFSSWNVGQAHALWENRGRPILHHSEWAVPPQTAAEPSQVIWDTPKVTGLILLLETKEHNLQL